MAGFRLTIRRDWGHPYQSSVCMRAMRAHSCTHSEEEEEEQEEEEEEEESVFRRRRRRQQRKRRKRGLGGYAHMICI